MIDFNSFQQGYVGLLADPRWQTIPNSQILNLWDVGWLVSGKIIHTLAHLRFLWILAFLLLRLWLRRKPRIVRTAQAPAQMPALGLPPTPKPPDLRRLLAQADELAGKGAFLAATSLLFKAGVLLTDRPEKTLIEDGHTVREISAMPFPPAWQSGFQHMGQIIERGRFAGQRIDNDMYQTCRSAFVRMMGL